jgi:hypothetical protein
MYFDLKFSAESNGFIPIVILADNIYVRVGRMRLVDTLTKNTPPHKVKGKVQKKFCFAAAPNVKVVF